MKCHDETFKTLPTGLNKMLSCNEGRHYKDCPEYCLGIELRCLCGKVLRKFTDEEMGKMIWNKFEEESKVKPLPIEN